MTMTYYLGIFQLILGAIGVFYAFYDLRRDIIASRQGRQGGALGKSNDTTPVKFRKHA